MRTDFKQIALSLIDAAWGICSYAFEVWSSSSSTPPASSEPRQVSVEQVCD
jgi:hypothetical protein